ncbi:hypothetical protein [Salinactinospora qingdaonensis]|uniref:Peptidase inhibitor family I36 n=1 Tax=Salinactinospora qingdaonensis TaxID=702744 RepID=A0ABP7FHG2_9ACTN
MSRLRTFSAAALGAAVMVSTLAGGAHSAAAEAAGESRVALQADGYFYAYTHAGYNTLCHRWEGNARHWGHCNDKVSSVLNNGFPGHLDDVWVYKHAGYNSPGRGIYNGVGISNLRNFTYDGTNQHMNDSISSHRWVNLP